MASNIQQKFNAMIGTMSVGAHLYSQQPNVIQKRADEAELKSINKALPEAQRNTTVRTDEQGYRESSMEYQRLLRRKAQLTGDKADSKEYDEEVGNYLEGLQEAGWTAESKANEIAFKKQQAETAAQQAYDERVTTAINQNNALTERLAGLENRMNVVGNDVGALMQEATRPNNSTDKRVTDIEDYLTQPGGNK